MIKEMKRLNNKKGFTLAELLIVVAIIVILAGISFIALPRYLRLFRQLEYDNHAKEIFIAAQNHLTMAENEGYLGINEFGVEEIESEKATGAYYFVVNNSNVSTAYNNDSALKLMLPTGSIDDTVRLSGSYIIRYDKANAKVLDVFYTNENDSTYGRKFAESDYDTLMGLRDVYTNGEITTDKKLDRRNYETKVIGWYGGEDVEKSPVTIKAPIISIENKDELKVTAEKLTQNSEIRIVLIGKTSGAEAYVPDTMITNSGDKFTCTLDSIKSGRFYTNFPQFIPGENISVQAVGYINTALSNIAYSSTLITNTLFADGSTEDTAYITHFRHLENLDKAKSSFDSNDTSNKLNIIKAVQLTDLDWEALGDTNRGLYNNKYDPVDINYQLAYDGKDHTIRNLVVTCNNNNGGVFGLIDSNDTNVKNSVSNLRILDEKFANTSLNVGGLAGTTVNTNIDKVYVYCSDAEKYNTNIVSGSNAGGLVSLLNGGNVNSSAAAVKVTANGSGENSIAGGLISVATNNASVTNSYSGGHTVNGAYTDNGNVTGRIAGGLVGSSTNARIDDSYSTCSVYGYSIAGGLVGNANSTTIEDNSYATGRIIYNNAAGLFVGHAESSNLSGWYLLMPNYNRGISPCGNLTVDTIKEMDLNLAQFNTFLSSGQTNQKSFVYDNRLKTLYNNKYPLVTVTANSEHYGDFPEFETIVINN